MCSTCVHHFHVDIAIIHGYYISKNIICLSATCTGTTETECLTCYSASHRTFDSITKKCPCDS